MKFSLKALFWLVTTVALLLAVAGYLYKLGMEAGRIKEASERIIYSRSLTYDKAELAKITEALLEAVEK